MKIKLNTNQIVNLIIVGIFLFQCLPFLLFLLGTSHMDSGGVNWDNNLKPIDAPISEKLPHDQYVKLQDSVTTMRSLIDGDERLGEEFIFGNFGISHAWVCDSCSLNFIRSDDRYKTGHKASYIALKGWTLRSENFDTDVGKFYVKNGQGYVRRVVADTSFKKPNGSVSNKMHLADVPVKFRYNHKENYLLIPISNSLASKLTIVWGILVGLVSAYLLYLIAGFLHFIVDTSKGETFTDKNIHWLKLIAISLLGYPVVIYTLNYAMKFIFSSYFIPEVILKDNLQPHLLLNLVLAIIFLLLYKAFRQGKKLKEEQDLTI